MKKKQLGVAMATEEVEREKKKEEEAMERAVKSKER